ncbi:hypothetical protein DXG01_014880 [Tephrocybe rancida]|nr:hypothetical protein DXG01_014880 [Tephrocybe rancida]
MIRDVDTALTPAKEVLQDLYTNPHLVDSVDVPAKAWLELKNKNIQTSLVPFCGPLTTSKVAQIANWFETKITRDPTLRCHVKWVTHLPNAHARTLYIASLLQNETKNKGLSSGALMEQAWQVQKDVGPPHSDSVDVELESLKHLEEMFERGSSRAGIAGHYQWGLDTGDHQGRWDPYAGTPTEWYQGD